MQSDPTELNSNSTEPDETNRHDSGRGVTIRAGTSKTKPDGSDTRAPDIKRHTFEDMTVYLCPCPRVALQLVDIRASGLRPSLASRNYGEEHAGISFTSH